MQTLADIQLKPNDRRAIEAAAQVLRRQFGVEQVILFGSKARGEDDAESDIDLLVLTRRPLTWEQQRELRSAIWPLQLEHGVVFSTMIVGREEWTDGLYQALPIRTEVDRDGVAA